MLSTEPSLSSLKIGSVITHRRYSSGIHPLVSVHEDTTLGVVLMTLREEKILSVPIYKTLECGGKEFTGIISVFDLLSFTVFQQIFDIL
jgi:CBS domain-containing protein